MNRRRNKKDESNDDEEEHESIGGYAGRVVGCSMWSESLSQYDLDTMYTCMSIVVLENPLPGCTRSL